MPEISSQESGAREGALAKVGRAAGKAADAKGAVEKGIADAVVPGQGEINPVEEILGPKKGRPSLEKGAIERKAAADKKKGPSPKKKALKAGAGAAGMAGAATGAAGVARALRTEKAAAKKARGSAGKVGAVAGGVASKVTSRVIIKYMLGVCAIYCVCSLIIIGLPLYLLYLGLLYMIMFGLPNLAKNILVSLMKVLPLRLLMPPPMKLAYDAGMGFMQGVRLRMTPLEMLAVLGLTIPIILALFFLIILIILVSAVQGFCDQLGPLCRFLSPLTDIIFSSL